MASSPPSTYPDWKAPREDGQTLIWPEPTRLLDETRDNQRRLSGATTTLVQNVPLSEVRRRERQWIGQDHDDPIVGDGHQTELHHPGVWVKRVLTHFAASRLSGHALHFAVDTDAPKHLILRWPGGGEPITDDPDLHLAHWTGLLDAPTPAHIAHLERRLHEARFARKPVIDDFLVSLRRLSLEEPKLPPALTNALHELDWSLGLRHHALLAGPVWTSEPFLVFAHHLVARAGEFATQYNAALADYRRAKKVRTSARPMPDLAAFDQSVELPFWLDDLSAGARSRPSAFARGDGFVIALPNGQEFDFDPAADGWDAAGRLSQWLRANQLRISPRALTLTMFLRLFVVDQFVHGIGGGRYDQITDRLIASHFKLDPPRFAVATATMYLPEAVGRSRVCVACVEQEGHRLRHSVLGERKMELVGQINAAPRGSPQRYATFSAMRRELADAARNHAGVAKWEQRLRETRAAETEESAIFDRELFYALQPRDRLAEMVKRFEMSL
jgi:hypothetical protein